MKKLLTILFILPLIFSSCEKEEETQSNNNNNSSDVIIGDWEEARQLNFPHGGAKHHYTFYYNNTYDDYFLMDEDGSMDDLVTGTWENLGGGVYYLSLWGGKAITPIFYCDENVLSWEDYPDNLHDYWGKNNYDVQSCSEINL